jgi:hypothetical protein
MDMTISGVTEVTGVTANEYGVPSVTPAETQGVTRVTNSLIPGENDRPCFKVFDDWTENGTTKLKPGVWHFGVKEDELTQAWVCSPVHVLAVTHDGQSTILGGS